MFTTRCMLSYLNSYHDSQIVSQDMKKNMVISELLSFITIIFFRCFYAFITVFGLATKISAILCPLSVCKDYHRLTKSDFVLLFPSFQRLY